MKKRILLILLIASTAYGGAQFVRTGPKVDRPEKDYTTLEVYYDPKDVEYPYKEIGRVFLEGNLSATKQIYLIRDRAAYFGADAVIILGSMESQAEGGAYGKAAHYESNTATRFTGIAIIKKEPVMRDANLSEKKPETSPVVSMGATSSKVISPTENKNAQPAIK